MPRKFFRRFLPRQHKVRENRVMAWLGPWLHHPHLWHVSREGIARGVAIGGFFGLIIPFGQIPAAALAAIPLRANVPIAAAMTLITNPFTFAPIYYFAYKFGLYLLGVDATTEVTPDSFAAGSVTGTSWLAAWWERLLVFGKPLFLGLTTLAVSFAALSYLAISWTWRVLTMRAWRARSWGKRNRDRDPPA